MFLGWWNCKLANFTSLQGSSMSWIGTCYTLQVLHLSYRDWTPFFGLFLLSLHVNQTISVTIFMLGDVISIPSPLFGSSIISHFGIPLTFNIPYWWLIYLLAATKQTYAPHLHVYWSWCLLHCLYFYNENHISLLYFLIN